MFKTKPTWEQFEDLVRRILEANNFRIQSHSPRGDSGFDFLGILGNDQWAIEVKYYRTARARPSLIESAAARVVNNGLRGGAQKGMLVISSVLPSEMRLVLEEKFSISFADRTDLRNYASVSPALAEELDSLLEADPDLARDLSDRKEAPWNRSRSINERQAPPSDTKGTELCTRLKDTKRGKQTWSQYEELCIDVLKYLFPNDLQGWHAQKRTDDGVSRYDFVCRVRPMTEFWSFLVEHLNSRYVIFEFKNYVGKIKQGQVLTTEKYLLERGLRKVAIVLTRAGADKNAFKMMQGAMREHGKLMLVVDDKNLCRMLHMKEQGEDPTDYLFELADDFLLSLPR
ncbi:restriction endonuclease [Billgrantia sp. Q4P2]|uniref:restriction endonuclease n=1 Tax=Billgrantia sp. Q4P2 TaxID=3463857 RepID=UPI0040567C7F